MKIFNSLLFLSLLCVEACFVKGFQHHARAHENSQNGERGYLKKGLLVDPLTKPIEVTGDHAFIAPNFAAGDQRGPCPGLNALANHGYIRRDGVTSLADAVIFGMGVDLGSILAVMGTVWVGNPLSLSPGFSIGGKTGSASNILHNGLGLLGTPQGLVGSHNLIESDSSNTRNDLYATGDAESLQMNKFMEWYNMSTDPVGDYNIDLMGKRASMRFQQSKAENPEFYYGPFTGMISRNAGYIFPARLFANYSSENPSGKLTKEIIKSFFAVSGNEGSFKYKRGHESIPQNWYRTPVDYSLAQLNLDLIDWISKYPELGSIGGNTGTVNSFAVLDISNITGGVLNTAALLQDNNLLCFALQIVKTAAPNSLGEIFSLLTAPLKLLTDILNVPLLDLSCPAWQDLTRDGKSLQEILQDLYPGIAKNGTGL